MIMYDVTAGSVTIPQLQPAISGFQMDSIMAEIFFIIAAQFCTVPDH